MAFAPNFVLHKVTRQLCEAYLKDPTTGLLLYGDNGCGLQSLAHELAVALNPNPDGILSVTPEEGKDITIDQIRQLYHDTRAKRERHLSVIIDDAETMSVPAQNAFLKLLEEPPERVVFILTSHVPNILLATIRSRVSSIEVRSISEDDSRTLIRDHGVTDATNESQLLFLASGKPAGLLKLINDPEYFASRAETIRVARRIIGGSAYERLIILNTANDRDKALEIVHTLGDVITFTMKKSASEHSAGQLDVIANTIDNLQANANVRLQLLSLALSL